MDAREEDRWAVYVSLNKDCPFCYLNADDTSIGDDPGEGRLDKLKNSGRELIRKLRALRRMNKGDNSLIPKNYEEPGYLRLLSRRLAVGRRARDISENF